MESTNYKASDIAVAIALAALLGPAYIQPQWSDISWVIFSMTWRIAIGSTIIPLVQPWILFLMLPITFMRLIVAFMFYRLYQRKTTVKRVLMIILVSEIQPFLLYNIPLFIFAMLTGFSYNIPFIIPIPFLALIALLILRAYPPPKKEFDWVKKSGRVWWENVHQAT